VALGRFISKENGMLFEIHLSANRVAVDTSYHSQHQNEFEVLVAAYTIFRVDGVAIFHIRDECPECK
jgi:hypothetical protein